MHRRFALLTATALVLAGCSGAPAQPAPGASETPATAGTHYTCTPEMGGTPYPCSAEDYTQMQRMNVLYDEATARYKQFFNVYAKLFRAGGGDATAADSLTPFAGGAYLAGQTARLAELRAAGVKGHGGDVKLARVRRSPGASNYGYVVALDVCIDARSVELQRNGQTVGRGSAHAERVFFKRDQGVLKAWDAESQAVQAC